MAVQIQEVSVFLLARQLQQPNVLIVDTRPLHDFYEGTRLKTAIPYYDGLAESEIGMVHYERVIAYGPRASEVLPLFSANHYAHFTGDLEALAKEFPDHCWSSMADADLAHLLEQPTTLVVDTRRDGFNSGLRLRNAVNFIPNVGFTGWCRRVVSHPFYRDVVCYGPEAPAAAAAFPDCNVHIYIGSLDNFATRFPQHCFDTRRCSTYCHKMLANELVPICDTLHIGSLVTPPSRVKLSERGITHLVVFTRGPKEAQSETGNSGCNSNHVAPDAERTPNHNGDLSSTPPSPCVAPPTQSVDVFPESIRLLHLQECGNGVRILTDRFHYMDFLRLLPGNPPGPMVDLAWVVELLRAIALQGHRAAVLCELGISRSTATAVAFLHLVQGVSPADALNTVNNACNFCNPSDLLNSLPSFYIRSQYTSPYKDLVISHIMPGLLCGSLQSLTGSRRPDAPVDPAILTKYGVTHVLSLGERPDLKTLPVKCLHIEVEDSERDGLADQWPQCFAFIDEARQGNGTVMVHCLAGVSRTGAIVIGYLMHHFGAPLRDAFLMAWRKRPILQPNDAFLEELVRFEETMFPTPSLPIAAVKDFELSHRMCFRYGV